MKALDEVEINLLKAPFYYEGVPYFTIGQTARIVNKSVSSVCHYTTRGTRWGVLKSVYLPPFGDTKMIPASEITRDRFPWIGKEFG